MKFVLVIVLWASDDPTSDHYETVLARNMTKQECKEQLEQHSDYDPGWMLGVPYCFPDHPAFLR